MKSSRFEWNHGLWCVWILLILLKIESWKHYSKIIFKCVNSAVWPIFNESFVEKIGLWGSWIVHEPLESWNVLLKKIKSINANVQLSSVSKQILEDSISVRIFIINIYIYIYIYKTKASNLSTIFHISIYFLIFKSDLFLFIKHIYSPS